MIDKKIKKKIGIGSLSLPLSIVTLLLLLTDTRKGCLGRFVLNYKHNNNIPHGIIGVLFLLVCIYISNKYSNHLFAILGRRISLNFLYCFIILNLVIFSFFIIS